MPSNADDPRLRDAYARCLRLASEHYENFPVASHALPRHLRAPVAAIYAFARTADDYADEGEHSPEERLALLAAWRRRVDALAADGAGDEPVADHADEDGCSPEKRLALVEARRRRVDALVADGAGDEPIADHADEDGCSPEERLALIDARRCRVDAFAADSADEAEHPPAERLASPKLRRRLIDLPSADEAGDELVFIALADVRARHGLPLAPLYDLLDAFTQDVTRRRYADEADLLDYCRRSANPVGRLLLHLFGQAEDVDLAQSDDICTALQLINFLQDLSQDYEESGRIYTPLDEMAACGVDETHFAQRRTDEAMLNLIAIQAVRARRLLDRGAPLAWRLRGRIGLELRMIVTAAGRILDRIAAEREDVFRRPRLQRSDWPAILWQTLTGPKGSDPNSTRLPQPTGSDPGSDR